jgi:chemotaxis protein methyltransferase CheR
MLSEHMVPELLSGMPSTSPLKIWSAACSSGQEPYSITMVLADLVAANRLRVVATDLNQKVLDRAKTGRYSQLEVNRGLPVTMLVEHFTRAGAEWQVSAKLRAAVSFARHNLMDAPPLGGPFDVVFLRNVLIYFDTDTKRNVLRRVRQVIRPGGFLLLGAAETTIGIDDSWERVTHGSGSVYRFGSRRAA